MNSDININRSWRASSPPRGAAVWPRMAGYLKGWEKSRYSRWASMPANYYCPHIVARGRGFVRAGGKVFSLSQGDMFSIWEGENIEYWGDPPDSWDFYWIHLEGAETKNLLEGWGFARDKLVFRPRDPEAAARLFIQIYSAYYERRESEAYRVVSWLYELGAVCGNSPQPGPPPEDRAHLAGEVLSLIKSSAQPSVNVSQAAAAFGVSRATLFRAFKNAGLRSPVEEIQAARIEKAKQLLASSTLKLSAVADICGFQDTKYFINSFKRITGKSPGAWRGGR